MELRYTTIDKVEFPQERIIEGYALLFDNNTDLGKFQESIERRALDAANLDNVFLLFNHKYDNVLARTPDTLNLTVTDKGLHFRAELPDTSQGNDIYTLIKRGDLKGMSFGFKVAKDKWNLKANPPVRSIQSINDIDEISIVPRPAYPDTSVATRSLDAIQTCLNCKPNPALKEANEIIDKIKGHK